MKSVQNQPEYQGQTNPPDADFPQGSHKDSPTSGQGTPYVAVTANKLEALIQRLFQEAGESPNGVDDTVSACQLYDVAQSVLNNPEEMDVEALPPLGLPAGKLQDVLNALGNGAVSTRQTSPGDATPNRLLTPGAFGLGGNCIMTTNVNTLTTTGFYYTDLASMASNTGAPEDGLNVIVNIELPFTNIHAQVAISNGTDSVYFRIGQADPPIAWIQLATTP